MYLASRLRLAVLAGASTALLGACQADRAMGTDPVLAKGSSTTSGSGSTDTTRVSIRLTVTSGTSTYVIGAHKIVFGAGLASICSPSKSSYGNTEWDKPCTAATSDVTIAAKSWYDAYGHPQVDFSPALRFVPTSDPARMVMLYLKDRAEASRLVGRQILYCLKFTSSGKGNTSCVDESLVDPTLATYLDTNGFLVRRIKHFSGYNVAARDDDMELY
jgi:hypothetical protein